MRHISAFRWASLALAAILLAASGLLLWGSTYVHNTVRSQLAEQQVYFPPQAAFAHPKAGTEITPSMIPSVSQYAGQQMLTGQQAEAYANNFIAVHLTEIGGGKTYSQLSAAAIAQPNNVKLAGQVATVFKGTTLRSMLLNAYGWWKVSQLLFIAAIVALALGGLALIGSVFGFVAGRQTQTASHATPSGPRRKARAGNMSRPGPVTQAASAAMAARRAALTALPPGGAGQGYAR
jgi:hypothetical protein